MPITRTDTPPASVFFDHFTDLASRGMSPDDLCRQPRLPGATLALPAPPTYHVFEAGDLFPGLVAEFVLAVATHEAWLAMTEGERARYEVQDPSGVHLRVGHRLRRD